MKQKDLAVKLIFSGITAVMLFVSCDKNTFNTKPELDFLGAESYDVSRGDILGFRLRARDKEGDLTDSIWIRAFTRRCPNSIVTLPYKLPEFPISPNLDTELNIRFIVGTTQPPIWNLNLCPGPDTTIFQFWIRDGEGNFSDTVETDRPIINRNN
jgi:hypothetical protein